MADSSYISSTNVNVFPSTYRSQIISGKLTTEDNFSNIIRSITDIDSYILSTTGDLEFVIYGYYFKVKDIQWSDEKLYASIRIESGSKNLVNWADGSTDLDDENYKFNGLFLSNALPTSTNEIDGTEIHSLQLKSGWEYLESNKIRLYSDSIGYSNSNTSLTAKINTKQDIISSGFGISIEDGKKVKFAGNEESIIKSLQVGGDIADGQHLVKFEKDTGKVSASGSNIGQNELGDGQWVYLKNGKIEAGARILAGPDSPPTTANVGDIYIKYKD